MAKAKGKGGLGRGLGALMTDYEEKFHNMGTHINRCVGTKLFCTAPPPEEPTSPEKETE